MDSVRICLVGAGWTACNHFAGYAATPDKAQVVACVARTEWSKERARQWAPTPKIFDSFEGAMADGNFDAVDLCVPHHLHAPMILTALRANKHVLVETPTCITLDECRQLRLAVHEHPHLKAATAHVVRVWRTYQQAKQLVSDGAIGEVFHAYGDYAHKPDPSEYPSRDRWGYSMVYTGRLSISYHTVDLLRWMVGDVEEVYGDYNDDAKIAILRFKNGAMGEVMTSGSVVRPYTLAMTLHGRTGTIQCYFHENVLKGYLHISAEWQPVELEPQPLHGRGTPEWKDEMENFVDAIREDKQPVCPLTDGIATVETCLAIDAAMTMGTRARVRQ